METKKRDCPPRWRGGAAASGRGDALWTSSGKKIAISRRKSVSLRFMRPILTCINTPPSDSTNSLPQPFYVYSRSFDGCIAGFRTQRFSVSPLARSRCCWRRRSTQSSLEKGFPRSPKHARAQRPALTAAPVNQRKHHMFELKRRGFLKGLGAVGTGVLTGC